MRLVVLTANHLRHHYFVNTIAATFPVVGVFQEVKRSLIQASPDREIQTSVDVMSTHLTERDAKEQEYFGAHTSLQNMVPIVLSPGEVNSPEVFRQVQALAPDCILLFGTSIIKPPLLSEFEGRMINMHLGLSPYYRGAATNFWPLVNNQPECVGATIHHAILKVDAGPILAQIRPDVTDNDGPHDLGCKTIIAGVKAILSVLSVFQNSRIPEGRIQPASGGLLYKRKDFTADAVGKMRDHFRNGMIPAYLAEKESRDRQFPLVYYADRHQLSLHS